MFSPEAITVTTKSEIAIVDNIRETVQLFDLNGGFLHIIGMEKTWGRKPNYPTNIFADTEGGFIVEDFNGEPPFVWMKPDGTVREQFHPKHGDGRRADAGCGVRVAPDGKLWHSDGHALMQLDADRVAAVVLGVAPKLDELGPIVEVAGDPHGRLYAVDGRTGAVHVFDANGRKLRVCKPARDDFSENPSPTIAVADDGSVYLGRRDRNEHLHFAPDGSRVGKKNFELDAIHGAWFPRGRDMLVLGDHAVWLTDENGKVRRTIERRADRKWLAHPHDAAVASDGSFAITSAQGMGRRDWSITFFSAAGDALHTAPLHGFAKLSGFNGTHAVFVREGEIVVCDNHGAPVQRFPSKTGDWTWGQFLTCDGRELWALDFSTRKVRRYAMPAAK